MDCVVSSAVSNPVIDMTNMIKTKESVVWLILAGLTCVAWLIGNKYSSLVPEAFKYMTVAVVVLAFFKVRLVILYFMEIDHAPLPLRIIFEAWCVIFCAVVSVMYFIV